MLHVKDIDYRVTDVRLRMPFRFGIVTMTHCPHLLVKVTLEVDGKVAHGLSADSLPPKWFTKNPDTTFQQEIQDMLRVIQSAGSLAVSEGSGDSVYRFISCIYARQKRFGEQNGFAPLLYNFGVSLIERAIIEAYCKAKHTTFAAAIRQNLLGVQFTAPADQQPMLDERELAGTQPGDWLCPRPLRQVYARHTVGLLDYLTDHEIAPGQRLDDGLPQSLDAAVKYYGLSRFKIKVSGDIPRDVERLRGIFGIASRHAPPDWAFTFDCNENFKEIAPFREMWRRLVGNTALADHLHRLIFVEQPLHRDIALADQVQRDLLAWEDRPPIIIDESDSFPGAARRALDCGYAGASHKNCKGIIKGLANVCLLEKRRRDNPSRTYILSGEDLCSIGPVSVQQDLAFDAAVGIDNIERNGHHFVGPLPFDSSIQNQAVQAHGDFYRRHERGFVSVDVKGGRLEVGSLIDAPFGVGFELDSDQFSPLSAWRFEG